MNKKSYKYYPLMLLLLTLLSLPEGISNKETMRWGKAISIIAILITLSSCVKVFSPKIKSSDLNKYVVSGQVIMGNQTQNVNVSFTSPISDTTYRPLTGCKVTIEDNESHDFPMIDLGNGDYSTLVDPKYLVPGHVFMISVVTPDGDSIISDYDTLQQVLPVDSIYYLRKDVENPVTGKTTQGIQFYINLNGTQADSRYYRWVIYETWEYHALFPLEFYWDGALHHVYPPDSSEYTCWDTRKIPEIFTLSTANLSQNKYDRFPLHYVDNTTPKLFNGYSILVEQLAMSKMAYNYWNQLKANSTQAGGLYEKQPLSIRGNLHDITHPDKVVLGFFSTESASYKRIFISGVPGLHKNYIKPGKKLYLVFGYAYIPGSLFPAPIEAYHDLPTDTLLSDLCINCLLQGGDTIKPSFWPN